MYDNLLHDATTHRYWCGLSHVVTEAAALPMGSTELWDSMDYYGLLWDAVRCYGILRDAIDCYGMLW